MGDDRSMIQQKYTLSSEEDILNLIQADPWMMDVLRAAKSLKLPDWWVCAGFVRTKIWDTLHGYSGQTSLPDVDVVYYDPNRTDESYEKELESQLGLLMPDIPWSVKNEARMHEINSIPPYSSTVDAISQFPETVTALGLTLDEEEGVVLTAPCGIEDVLRLHVKPTPAFRSRPELMEKYERRIVQKNWRSKWPKVIYFHGITRDEDDIESELIAKLEQAAGDVQSIELQAEQGCTSRVRRVVTGTGTYILKSATDSRYREWLRVEAERLRRNGGEELLSIPKFAAFHEESDSSHLLMSCEKGITLTAALKGAAREEKIALLQSFGRFLHRFHERSPVESLAHGGDWLEERLATARRYLELGQSEGDEELLEQLVRNKPSSVRQTMIHGDCTADNVLVHDGEVYLFIDVSGMTVGDPRYDESLAIGGFFEEPELLNAFYEGYTRYRVTEDEYRYFDEGLYSFF